MTERKPITCPACGHQILGIVNITYRHVPMYTDGYHGPDGDHVKGELVKAYCPECDTDVFIDSDAGKATVNGNVSG